MIKVEFHCHTVYSKDSLTSPERLVAACRKKGIEKVVVTDHDTIAGARAAQEIDPQLVVVGEEIMTRSGELLAAFVQEEVPAGLGAAETIAILREQGAFISVSHPFDQVRKGHWAPEELLKIIPLVDAIETFNARCMWPEANQQAQAFAREHNLLGTAGSDAHAVVELGAAAMLLPPFENAEELKQALTQVEFKGRLSGPWVHFYSRYATYYKRMARMWK